MPHRSTALPDISPQLLSVPPPPSDNTARFRVPQFLIAIVISLMIQIVSKGELTKEKMAPRQRGAVRVVAPCDYFRPMRTEDALALLQAPQIFSRGASVSSGRGATRQRSVSKNVIGSPDPQRHNDFPAHQYGAPQTHFVAQHTLYGAPPQTHYSAQMQYGPTVLPSQLYSTCNMPPHASQLSQPYASYHSDVYEQRQPLASQQQFLQDGKANRCDGLCVRARPKSQSRSVIPTCKRSRSSSVASQRSVLREKQQSRTDERSFIPSGAAPSFQRQKLSGGELPRTVARKEAAKDGSSLFADGLASIPIEESMLTAGRATNTATTTKAENKPLFGVYSNKTRVTPQWSLVGTFKTALQSVVQILGSNVQWHQRNPKGGFQMISIALSLIVDVSVARAVLGEGLTFSVVIKTVGKPSQVTFGFEKMTEAMSFKASITSAISAAKN